MKQNAKNLGWAIGLLVVALALVGWRVLSPSDPSRPTASVSAGVTPVTRASGEALNGHDFVLPPLPKK